MLASVVARILVAGFVASVLACSPWLLARLPVYSVLVCRLASLLASLLIVQFSTAASNLETAWGCTRESCLSLCLLVLGVARVALAISVRVMYEANERRKGNMGDMVDMVGMGRLVHCQTFDYHFSLS